MSESNEFELDLDLQLLPAWAREPSTDNRFAKFEGGPEQDRRGRPGQRFGRRQPWGDRPPRRDRPPGGREGGEFRGPRSGPGEPPRSEFRRGPRGNQRRDERAPERQEPLIPLPEIDVQFTPEEKGVEMLARQIKLRGRAYPLFEIAALILKQPDRYHVQFATKKGPDDKVLQPLIACSIDESLWLNEDEVADHVLRHHFAMFYQTEKVPTDPPKGTYTFVAQCGLTGTILGPPNYHDYQNKLRKLHAERFARMPFEVFKSRVKIVKDEAVVKSWIEDQSWRTAFVCLNVPEVIKYNTREELDQHFRTVHLPNLMRSVDTFDLPGGGKRPLMSPALGALLRRELEQQKRFPLRVATVLSQQFAGWGLQFFKVNRTVTHVCVARPHYLDLQTTVVSETVRRIVEFIDKRPGCTRRAMLETLAPTPAPVARAPVPLSEGTPGAATPVTPEAAAASSPIGPETSEPTPEQTALISDLHWLIHQGHVIEFSDGRLETAKAPKPKPPPPERPKPVEAPEQALTPPTEAVAAAGEPQAVAEIESSAAAITEAPVPEPTSAVPPTDTEPAPAPEALAAPVESIGAATPVSSAEAPAEETPALPPVANAPDVSEARPATTTTP